MKIIQITDIHMLADVNSEIWGVNPYELFKSVIEQIKLINGVDCIIITGDIADNGEYDAYMNVNKLVEKLKCPVYWLQGNHDLSEVMLQVSNKVTIQSQKSFIIQNTKFILLQSVMRDEENLSSNKARGYLFDCEMSFLKRELDENNYDNCLIALHHPPVLANTWTDRRILDNRLEFISLIEKYPKVKAVLYGHQHIAQQTELNGIKYISSPPSSFHYNAFGEKFSLIKDRNGFGIITIDRYSAIKCEFIFKESFVPT